MAEHVAGREAQVGRDGGEGQAEVPHREVLVHRRLEGAGEESEEGFQGSEATSVCFSILLWRSPSPDQGEESRHVQHGRLQGTWQDVEGDEGRREEAIR